MLPKQRVQPSVAGAIMGPPRLKRRRRSDKHYETKRSNTAQAVATCRTIARRT
jgi:hypothetical protein